MSGYTFASGIYTSVTTIRCPECLTVREVSSGMSTHDEQLCCSTVCLKRYKVKLQAAHKLYLSSKLKRAVVLSVREKRSLQLYVLTAQFVSSYEIPYPR